MRNLGRHGFSIAVVVVALFALVPLKARAQAGLIVTITSPASGSTVSGIVTVNATVTANGQVNDVQFRLDGANLGGADSSAPYSVSWNTATASNAAHTLTAVARSRLRTRPL